MMAENGWHTVNGYYLGNAAGLTDSPSAIIPPSPHDTPAWSVASAGDVNGDGFDDVVIGGESLHQAYVYLGSAQGLSTTPTFKLPGPSDTNYGQVVSIAGDTNGDGFDDIIVNAEHGTLAYLYLGGPQGVVDAPIMLTAPSGGDFISMKRAGDINGDGFDDVLANSALAKAAYVFFGSATGLATEPLVLQGPSSGDFAVLGVAAADIDGDGFSDVLVGDDQEDLAFVFLGRADGALGMLSGMSSQPSLTLQDGPGYRYGAWMKDAGDLNGDGIDDVVIGTYTGVYVNVYLGNTGAFPATPSARLLRPTGAYKIEG
jgi:hypothetical protein